MDLDHLSTDEIEHTLLEVAECADGAFVGKPDGEPHGPDGYESIFDGSFVSVEELQVELRRRKEAA